MNIRLRKLEVKDIQFMLEWMHDSSISCYFRFDSMSMTAEDCNAFVCNANIENDTKHFAIVDDSSDEYLGTISLKNIDHTVGEAEYAISTRKKVHGTGVALMATHKILMYAFDTLKLRRVYLNVLAENSRANAFYKKVGFVFDYSQENAVEINGIKKTLNWYSFETIPNIV